MSGRIRGYSSTWDLKENPEHSQQNIRNILPTNREDIHASNESRRAWQQKQVDCDSIREHDKIFKKPGFNSTLLDAPLPWKERESFFTRMSPGLDNWRQEKHKPSLESGWNSSNRFSSLNAYYKEGEVNIVPPDSGNGTKNQTNTRDEILRAFRSSLIDFVKEILKPNWKNGLISKDTHKIIVKKVVDKVLNSIPTARIPSSQEEITNYLSSSESKLTKLTEAYLKKHRNT